MKARITVLTLTLIMSACVKEPTSFTKPDGKLGYTINCNSGIEWCHKKAATSCPAGYDIIDHLKTSSTVVPHYGQYPMKNNTESLIVECK